MTNSEAEIVKWAEFFASRIVRWSGAKFADFMCLYGDDHSALNVGDGPTHKEIEKAMVEFLAPEAVGKIISRNDEVRTK